MVARSVRLLLAEDDENDAVFLARAFLKAGVSVPVERVSDGVEAVNRLVNESLPGVTHLLLDLKLPLKSGLEVLEWLTGRVPSDIHVAILSSSRVEEDVRRAYELGAEFYLVKPARTSDLVAICRQLGEWVGRDVRPALSADVLLPRPG
jgi:DNA-binding response OmpR family regulator